jgi:thiol-disulfide isomerase/thioredoxin
MVKVSSTMLALGTPAPPFALTDVVSGKTVRLEDSAAAPALLVMFICNHCPYVKHVRDELARLARDYSGKNLAIVAIQSNDVESYPDDAPDRMRAEAEEVGYTFPYLHDETQEVAKAYRAACTPDFYVFDDDRTLVYRGQLDDSRPGNDRPVNGKDLRAALNATLAGRKPDGDQVPSIGCNIKWKRGNAPNYFGS